MVDGHTLFDYSVGLNEIVQILVRAPQAPSADEVSTNSTSQDSSADASSSGASDKDTDKV